MIELKTAYEDKHVRITQYFPEGHWDDLVVAFTGIGHQLGALQIDEFVGTATHSGRAAMFVTDKNRSWFNAPGLYEQILAVVKPPAEKAKRTITLGNSMGGFGALLFAAPLGAHAALAFGPQASVSARVVPQERRWQKFRKDIREFRFEDVNDYLAPGVQYYVLHGAEGDDLVQIRAFRPAGNICLLLFPSAEHDVSEKLKKAGVLAPLIAQVIDGDDAQVKRLLADAGGITLETNT